MQSIAELLPKGRNSLQKAAQSSPAVAGSSQAALPWFDDAFREICLSCSAWRVSLPNGDWVAAAKRVWVSAFADAGLSDRASIQKGIDRLISQGQQYLPSPAEFIALCQPSPEDLGVTSLEAAYKEAIKKAHQRRHGVKVEWSHVVVDYAARRCSQELLEGREPAVKERFAAEYKYALEQFMKGELEQAQAQLAHQGKDEDALHYLHLLNKHGDEIAQGFLADCAARGKVINPKTGAVSQIEVSKPAGSVVADLTVDSTFIKPVVETAAVHTVNEQTVSKAREALAQILASLDQSEVEAASAKMARGGV